MWHLGRPTWEDCSAEASTDVHDLGDICVAGEDVRVRLLRVAGQHSESEEVALWQVKAVGGNISPGRSGRGELELSCQGMVAGQKGVFANSVLSVLSFLRPGGPRHAL